MSNVEQLLLGYSPPQEALRYMSQMHVDAEGARSLSKSRTRLFGEEDHGIIPFLFPEHVRSAVKEVDLSTYLVVLKEVPFSYTIPKLFDELNSRRLDQGDKTMSFDTVLKESNNHFAAYAGLCRYPKPHDPRRLCGMEAFYIDSKSFQNNPDLIAQDIAQRGERLIKQHPGLFPKLWSGQLLNLDDIHEMNKMIAWALVVFRDILQGNPAAEDYNFQTHFLAKKLPSPVQEVFYYPYGKKLFELYVMVQARLDAAHDALEFPHVPLSERGDGGIIMRDLLKGGQPIIRQLDNEFSRGISPYESLDILPLQFDPTR